MARVTQLTLLGGVDRLGALVTLLLPVFLVHWRGFVWLG